MISCGFSYIWIWSVWICRTIKRESVISEIRISWRRKRTRTVFLSTNFHELRYVLISNRWRLIVLFVVGFRCSPNVLALKFDRLAIFSRDRVWLIFNGDGGARITTIKLDDKHNQIVNDLIWKRNMIFETHWSKNGISCTI